MKITFGTHKGKRVSDLTRDEQCELFNKIQDEDGPEAGSGDEAVDEKLVDALYETMEVADVHDAAEELASLPATTPMETVKQTVEGMMEEIDHHLAIAGSFAQLMHAQLDLRLLSPEEIASNYAFTLKVITWLSGLEHSSLDDEMAP